MTTIEPSVSRRSGISNGAPYRRRAARSSKFTRAGEARLFPLKIDFSSGDLVFRAVPKRRRRQDPHRDARAEMYRGFVRDAAEKVFAEHGFARASMAQIARESRVS